MPANPMLTTLLDLDAALPKQELIVGGGYGLFLKQTYIADNPELRTLFPLASLPRARATEDIDLILRADVVTDSSAMKTIRKALDVLDFRVVETARYMQFVRPFSPGQVKIDLLAAPLGSLAKRVPKDPRRVKPRPSVKLHASKLEEAIAVDREPLRVPVSGVLSDGTAHSTTILIPQAFSYLLMKLFAFRDRCHDAQNDLGRHHAVDVYRIVGLLTPEEDAAVHRLSDEFSGNPLVREGCRIAMDHFVSPNGVGRLRIREHPLFHSAVDLDRLAEELTELLPID